MQNKSGFKGHLNENKKGCHAEFISASPLVSNSQSGEILKQVQDDTAFYNGVKAFTLIELLVVVLIIGILAAVAMPQYQRAVEKARMTEAVTAIENIARANEMYRLANGNFTRDINELDVDFPGENYWYSGIRAKKTKDFMMAASNANGEQYAIALVQRWPEGTKYSMTISTTGQRACVFYSEVTSYQRKLCQAWANGQ